METTSKSQEVLDLIKRDLRICAISGQHFKRIQDYLNKNPKLIDHLLGQGHSPLYVSAQIEKAC